MGNADQISFDHPCGVARIFCSRCAKFFAIDFVIAPDFPVSAPLSKHPLALFAPPCPLWAQLSPYHVQITQGKQHIELGIVFGQAFVARLLVFEDVLDHMKRVLHVGPDLGFEFLVGLRQTLLPSLVQLFNGLATLGPEFVNDFETPECINLVCNRAVFY